MTTKLSSEPPPWFGFDWEMVPANTHDELIERFRAMADHFEAEKLGTTRFGNNVPGWKVTRWREDPDGVRPTSRTTAS